MKAGRGEETLEEKFKAGRDDSWELRKQAVSGETASADVEAAASYPETQNS